MPMEEMSGHDAFVEEIEESFRGEREAIQASDAERISRFLDRIDGLLAHLVEAVRLTGSREALEALERASSLREGNAMLLREKLEELSGELSEVRTGRRAAAAYRPPGGEPRGLAVDREA